MAGFFRRVATTSSSSVRGLRDVFHRFARAVACAVGSPFAFLLAILCILIWAVTGPIFDFSDTWQLVINTGTTIITFLMVFLIQNTQNRETLAINLKLDELIRAVAQARTGLVDLEDLTDEELEKLHQEFVRLRNGFTPADPASVPPNGEGAAPQGLKKRRRRSKRRRPKE